MNLYVIGPVTGIPKDNLPMFNSVRGELMQAGHRVDIPHDCITSGVAWRYAMSRSIEQICIHLRWDGDKFGIAMLDGWEDSRGARIEHDLAEALGIECRPWREFL